jgi:hypothetical protein
MNPDRVSDTLDSRLLAQVRDVLDASSHTETELRALIENADGWERALRAQLSGSERRLDQLVADPSSSLAELACELHRVRRLRPALTDTNHFQARLQARARQLRSAWLLRKPSRGCG